MLKRVLQMTGVVQSDSDQRDEVRRELIRKEAKIGGELFGPVAPGGRREFFCLDEHTWIWHEEWQDAEGNPQSRTTRYDVRPNGVVKAQDGRNYQKISAHEANRLLKAVQVYQRRVENELYQAVI